MYQPPSQPQWQQPQPQYPVPGEYTGYYPEQRQVDQYPFPTPPPYQQYPPVVQQPQGQYGYPQQQWRPQPYYPQQQMYYPYPQQQVQVNINTMAVQRPQIATWIRILYFLLIGWWLGLLWASVALGLIVTIIGAPVGFVMLAMMGKILFL